MMFEKEEEWEEIKRVEDYPKENILLLQSSREQGKGQLSLKDIKLSEFECILEGDCVHDESAST
jgi:hypothetical protein